MRILNVTKSSNKIIVRDDPGPGGACHNYSIVSNKIPKTLGAIINFKKGVNGDGANNEDLISIVIDRLTSFQEGPFPCDENAMALRHLEKALGWLLQRTEGRIKRGVEGKDVL